MNHSTRLATVLFSALFLLMTGAARGLDAPHDSSNNISCTSCHTLHGSPGGSLTSVEGNSNLCISCHNPAGQASAKPLNDADRADPYGENAYNTDYRGTSHSWGVADVNSKADATTPTDPKRAASIRAGGYAIGSAAADPGNTSGDTATSGGTFSGTAEDTYTVTVSTGGAPGGGAEITTTCTSDPGCPQTQAVPAFDQAISIASWGVTVSFADSSASWSIGSATADAGNTGGDTATSGGSFTGSAEDTYTVEVTTGGAPGTAQITTTCTNDPGCPQTQTVSAFDSAISIANWGVTISFSDTGGQWTIGSATADPGNTGDDTGTSGGSYNPSGDYADITYTVEVTTGGAPGTAQITTTSTGNRDNSGPTTVTDFNTQISVGTRGVTISFSEPSPSWSIGAATADAGNTGGDTATSGGSFTGSAEDTYTVEVTTGGAPGTAQITTTCTSDPGCPQTQTVSAFDTALSIANWGVTISFSDTGGQWTIGSATADPGNTGDDTGTSGGSYNAGTDMADITYTVEVTTGGAPGTAQITTTSTGNRDNSGPTTVTAFNTPISVGTRGVTISFSEPAGSWNIGAATCVASCNTNHSATSGGSYNPGGDTQDITYSVQVTTGGDITNGEVWITVTSTGNRDNSGPTNVPDKNVAVAVGTRGVTISFDYVKGKKNFAVGETWEIAVTQSGGGDGVLTAGDKWTIAVTQSANGELTAGDKWTIAVTQTAGGDGVLTLNDKWTIAVTQSGNGQLTLNDKWTIAVTSGTGDGQLTSGESWTIAVTSEPDKIVCSTCHDQHNKNAGASFGFLRSDTTITTVNELCNDCHSGRDVTSSTGGSHPVGVQIPDPATNPYKNPTTLVLDSSSGTALVECSTCHIPSASTIHSADSGGANSGEGDGYLLAMSITTICGDCHDFPAGGIHFDGTSGALWPGSGYNTDYARMDGTAFLHWGAPGGTANSALPSGMRGACLNCHWPHGWTPDGDPANKFAKLLVGSGDDLCFTCHDGDPVSPDIRSKFNGATNYQDSGASGANINQRHDVSAADQAYSGGVVACANCHNPHYVTQTNKVMDPDDTTTTFSGTYSPNNSYTRDGYNEPYAAGAGYYDPVNPEGATGGPYTEPDYVEFCLTCHDGTTPPGVTMSPNMVNIADDYFSGGIQHGAEPGNTGTQLSKGYKKVPWTSQANFDAGREPDNPYAALQCTTCHDAHGSDNIFHLKSSITVAGVQMQVGGMNGNFPGVSPSTTYTLPLISGTQQYLYWGAWCTFCHTMSNHPGQTETSSCNSGHRHGGGNF